MKIRYKCKCDPEEREISVIDRVPGSDIADWMNAVAASVHYHHKSTSPRCDAVKSDYVKIPLPTQENAEIGTAPKLQS